MARSEDVDRLIREALEAEGLSQEDLPGEPGLPEMVVEIFRGRLRWYGVMFLLMILVLSVVGVLCGVRFLAAEEVPEMLRWGAGMLLSFIVVMNGKIWYWMQMERVATAREIKRVELMLAQLAAERRGGG